MKIFAVDDEKRYRDYLSSAFSAEGFQVQVAGNGRDAIDRGVCFQPDVLVVDWMLRDDVHGLHVAAVLQQIDPALRTILMTGFPCSDLRDEARFIKVSEYIEKPFKLGEMVTAVKRAAGEKALTSGDSLPVLVTDSSGRIRVASQGAREMLAVTRAGEGAEHIDQIFAPGEIPVLHGAAADWLEVMPLCREPARWCLRTKHRGESIYAVMLPAEDAVRRTDPVVEMLLEIQDAQRSTWPFPDRVLVLDDNWIIRTLAEKQLEQVGCVSYQAESVELGLKLLRADPLIGVVLVEHELPGTNLRALLNDLQLIRPGVKVVGNSSGSHREVFAGLGVERYLQKPWVPQELIEVLR